MENNPPVLGPLPTGPSTAPAMPASRAAILTALQQADRPLGLGEVVDGTGLHVNTVREQLEALVQAGAVLRTRATPQGRGRPAWLYAAADVTERVSPYAALAGTLASALAATSSSPRDDALRAGTGWGHDLARGVAPGAHPREQVAGLLDDLGFAPEPAPDTDGTVLRLTRCPLLDAARQHPDVVCAVHLGIVRGALVELGAEPAAELFPFSEPGACRLELA